MRTTYSSVLLVVTTVVCLLCIGSSQGDASDAAWVIDVTEVAADSLFGMCEDDNVIYFVGISAEQERRLCAVPLDTRELLWTIDLDTDDNFMPVIDKDGNIHISSNVNQEAYTISPSGVIIDTIAVTPGDPPGELVMSGDGTIKWSGTENGYTHGVNGIGAGGMIFEFEGSSSLVAYDRFGSTQWASQTGGGSLHYDYVTVDRNGSSFALSVDSMVTSNIIATTALGDGLWMIDNQMPFPTNFITAPVIGGDGTLYYGRFPNTIIRVSIEPQYDDPGDWHYNCPVFLNMYEGDRDLWGMPVDIYDLPNINPLMIVQDSLLCWAGKGYIEAFVIPSQGYQEDAYWPCFGHDNRRSFTTTAPELYFVSGRAFLNGEPYGGVTVEAQGIGMSTTTDETGAFSFSLPLGTYTLELVGTDITRTITVDDTDDTIVFEVTFETNEVCQLIWQSNLYDYNYYSLNPHQLAIDHNDNIVAGLTYIYSGDGRPGALFSFSPDGSRNWMKLDPIDSPPVIDSDNTIFLIKGEDLIPSFGTFYKFDENGSRKLIAANECSFPAAIDNEGIVYAHYPTVGIVGYDQSGAQVWQSEIPVDGAPVIDQSGNVYVASGSILTAFNTDGSVKWTYEASDTLLPEGLALSEGLIYASCSNMTIIALNFDGTLHRIYYLGGHVACAPAVDSDGTLYFGIKAGIVYALNPNGSVKWQTQVESGISTTPIIASDGRIFISGKTTLYALNPNGTVCWEYETPREAYYPSLPDSPIYLALGDNGILYCLTSRLKSLYAFQTNSPGLKTTAPWPCFRGNNQRTGRITDDTITPVEEYAPQELMLTANYPNPFNPSTTIAFTLPSRERTRLTVYSVTGQTVATLVDDTLEAGSHSVVFDGSGLASGLYFYRLEAGDMTGTGKMLLVK